MPVELDKRIVVQHTFTLDEEDLLIRFLHPMNEAPETFEVEPDDRPILDSIMEKLSNCGTVIYPSDQ